MFGNKRRVDLGGRKGPNRRKLLEDTRRQRAMRLQHQREKEAATRIQAIYRGNRHIAREKVEIREAFDRAMLHVAKLKPSEISRSTLQSLTRQILYFFSWKIDSLRLAKFCKLVCQSIKAPLESNYLSFLGSTEKEAVNVGILQTRKLLQILLTYIRERLQAKDRVGPFLAALYFIIDTRQMSCLPKQPKSVALRISRNHLQLVQEISNSSFKFFSSIRTALLHTTNLQTDSNLADAKLVSATLLGIALRPVTVRPLEDTKKWEIMNPRREFITYILSIPTFSQRFATVGLSRLVEKISSKAIWSPLMAAFSSLGEKSASTHALKENIRAEGKSNVRRALSILGNVLELGLGVLQNVSLNEKLGFFATVEILVRQVDDVNTDELSQRIREQLSLLEDKRFLKSLCECVREIPSSHVIFRLCGAMAFKFKSMRTSVLNAMVFNSSIINDLYKVMDKNGMFKNGVVEWNLQMREIFALFCICYNHLLLIQDDAEFFEKQKPCTLAQITAVVKALNKLLSKLYWEGGKGIDPRNLQIQWTQMREVATELFCQLRVRQSRKQFCNPDVWIMPQISFSLFKAELENGRRADLILQKIPFVLTFQQRVELFYDFIRRDRKESDAAGIRFGHVGGVTIRVRRDRVLADGFEGLTKVGKNIKGRIQVQFINEHGIVEAGIDGGGLFKEFVTELLRVAFDPQLGLFKQTSHEFTYPNPTSYANPNFSNHLAYFNFVGMIVGKCLYDGIILEPQFANFFLRKLLGYRNFVDDLASLDPEVYKNLLFLKNNSADGLGLTFSVTRDTFGDSKVVDLIENGSEVAVTDENRLRFIYEMADFKLNREIAAQSSAFVTGLNSIIKPGWLRMFEAEELDRLLSGTPVIDVADLRRNTNYAGGYDENHELIRWFWSILDNDFDEKERRHLLKFSTSVSRSPLLGFKHLYPKFCIQRSSGDTDNLPTSSTCMNLLKIPRYTSREKLKEKLRYSIKSSSGFYLT